jgi:probable F420-dependent oxidoreductase
MAPMPTLAAAAMVTTRLRLTTHVLANDFRNPVLLAQEVAAIDQISDGRFELGLGTGWLPQDYLNTGIARDPAGVRVSRLAEAVGLLKRLQCGDVVTHHGTYYQVQDAAIAPRPIQQPGVPLMLGGGGRRILSLAAREADIVSIDPIETRDGKKDFAMMRADVVAEQVGWIREAAGARFENLELTVLYGAVALTDNRQRAAEEMIDFLNNAPPIFANASGKTVAEILESPRCIIGSVDQIVEDLLMRRERYEISYITVMEFPGLPSRIDALAPVVARLAGK